MSPSCFLCQRGTFPEGCYAQTVSKVCFLLTKTAATSLVCICVRAIKILVGNVTSASAA